MKDLVPSGVEKMLEEFERRWQLLQSGYTREAASDAKAAEHAELDVTLCHPSTVDLISDSHAAPSSIRVKARLDIVHVHGIGGPIYMLRFTSVNVSSPAIDAVLQGSSHTKDANAVNTTEPDMLQMHNGETQCAGISQPSTMPQPTHAPRVGGSVKGSVAPSVASEGPNVTSLLRKHVEAVKESLEPTLLRMRWALLIVVGAISILNAGVS